MTGWLIVGAYGLAVLLVLLVGNACSGGLRKR
jgi:hypothetical protein